MEYSLRAMSRQVNDNAKVSATDRKLEEGWNTGRDEKFEDTGHWIAITYME